ncbi:19826_t:CDS:2, partial [Racocetra persica]
NNENLEQRTRPDSHIEQQCFCIYLRKKEFFTLKKINNTLANLDGDVKLSEEMKSFSILAKERRQKFIQNTLLQQNSTNVWKPIPVTEQEADSQRAKYTNLKNKIKDMLLTILQEIRDLNSAEEIIDEETTINELTDKSLTKND